MFYSIRHITRFRYSVPVRESVMELKMQPRSEGNQALRNFQISTNPRAQLYAYTDHLGNAVYHFNVLREHSELRIDAQSVIEVTQAPTLPAVADSLEWQRYNSLNLTAEHYGLLGPSEFARSSPELQRFAAANGLKEPQGDTLSALKKLNNVIFGAFDYEIGVTQVHSPIEQALAVRRGVCQDFAHIMIAIARGWGIPARYVSGYFFHRRQDKDRSGDDATHAWVETYLPSFGWVGFDPTNNILAGERHIRAAVGRDYDDVPPTRGTFKGDADSELAVAVTVEPTSAPVRHEEFLRVARPMSQTHEKQTIERQYQQQQQ
ncbi:MAG TPA: transglutaminase family protein [Micropepsaceae bacterium]|nr:transglutaminase family protein [Micropepsaceae bacterium]